MTKPQVELPRSTVNNRTNHSYCYGKKVRFDDVIVKKLKVSLERKDDGRE
jgi:hypothetical protein